MTGSRGARTVRSFASVNGRITSLEDARVPVLDHGFVFGDSVYEVVRTYGGHPFETTRHFRRLRASADRLGIAIAASDEELLARIRDLLDRAGEVESYVRIVVTRGVGNSSYDFDSVVGPTVVMMQKELVPIPERDYTEGIQVSLVDVRRNHPTTLDPAMKSSNLLNNIMALRQAQARGAQEAVLLNLDGFVAEGSSTNVFVVEGGRLHTPPLSAGILAGITRQVVIELAASEGVPVTEADLRLEDLLGADEAFLSSTTREVMPIRQVDDALIADGRPGEITEQLLRAFRAYAPEHCD
jgi:branched-chain amino acid aminotransferase